jgi:hypothetical protein
MQRLTVCFLSALLLFGSTEVGAQSDSRLKQRFDTQLDTVYLTQPVKKLLANEMANKISILGPQVGFSDSDTTIIASGIRNGDLRIESNKVAGPASPDTISFYAMTSKSRVRLENSEQLVAVANSVAFTSYAGFLQQFGTVRLVVQPVPPRDYKVIINGEVCPATKLSLYKVLPGAAAVEVNRIGKTSCSWVGQIPSGGEQVVECKF